MRRIVTEDQSLEQFKTQFIEGLLQEMDNDNIIRDLVIVIIVAKIIIINKYSETFFTILLFPFFFEPFFSSESVE